MNLIIQLRTSRDHGPPASAGKGHRAFSVRHTPRRKTAGTFEDEILVSVSFRIAVRTKLRDGVCRSRGYSKAEYDEREENAEGFHDCLFAWR